ncbi:MAG TPA: AAA family ATPase, partial [Fimbriiglobus sp.]|nr:AAA family ATPase [Fimbriiglobus sp.]
MRPWTDELCSDVRPAAIDWLWPRYLARGKLAILDGDPEMGKSLVTLDLIARLSRGGPLPDGTHLPGPCTSVLLSAEDDAADTIRPRAEAAGADLSRLVLPNFGGRVPRFPDDLPALEELVVERAAGLVVIDPLMAFLPPRVAANNDQCVRLALTPLAGLAARTGCAVKFVRHLAKAGRDRAVYRGQGSMGIMAAVRTALFAAPHPADPDGRVLAVAKSNMGRRPPALGYRVVGSATGQPVVEWTGPVELTADGLCRRQPATGVKARDRATDWLRRELSGGPRPAADLYAAAAAAGIPERTLERAKKDLPVR